MASNVSAVSGSVANGHQTLASRFPKPPLRSRTVGFPQSGSGLGFPLRAFPTLETGRILKPGKQADRFYARSLICHWAICSLGMTAVAVSKLLGINRPAVTQAAYRGEAIAAADSLELVER